MEGRTRTVDAYIRFGMFSVAGYLKSIDARLIALLLAFQRENGFRGNLCEIGVHHGRLFFILALARQAEERALAVDLFEDDAINAPSRWHRGRDRALLTNARRLNIALCDDELLKTSSLDISATDILERVGGPIRFFSVDGGHGYEHVANDLQLAKSTLSDNGIIAVDDFFNVSWPEVSLAVYDFIRATDEVVPFLLSPWKLYLAPPHIAFGYKEAVRRANGEAKGSIVRFLNQDVYLAPKNIGRVVLDYLSDTACQSAVRTLSRAPKVSTVGRR